MELRNWHCLLLIAVVGTVFSVPNLVFGISHGMSHLYNISWTYEFNRLFWSGDPYPRWLDGLNNGVGSLAWWIYAPLPFYVNALTGGLFCAGCEPTVQVAIGEWLMLLASGMTFFALARQYAKGWPALVGSVFYMLAPYHFEIDLWRRQAIGEFAAYIWMPLVVLYFERAVRQQPRALALGALVYAALVLSHLPAAVLFSLSLPLLALFHAVRNRSVQPLLVLGGMVVLGLALSSIYLLPALSIQAIDIYSHTGFHPWHYYAHWFFLDGKAEPDAQFATRLCVIWLTNTIAAVLLFIAAGGLDAGPRRHDLRWWLAACALVAFMVTPLSVPVWELLPFLQQVQFPWRIMIVTDLALAMLGVFALDALLASATRARAALVAAAGLLIVVVGLADWRQFTNFTYFYDRWHTTERQGDQRALQIGTDTPEYLPMWVKIDQSELVRLVENMPRASLLSGSGNVEAVQWANRQLGLRVRLSTEAEVQLRQVYVPWWQARVEGQGAAQAIATAPAPRTGLLTLRLPPGDYVVHVTLLTPPVERAGQAISAAALLVLGWLLIRARRRPAGPSAAGPSAQPAAT